MEEEANLPSSTDFATPEESAVAKVEGLLSLDTDQSDSEPEDQKEAQQAEEAEQSDDAPPEEAESGEDADEQEEAEASSEDEQTDESDDAEDDQEDEDSPAFDPPARWSKAEKEAFQTLPGEAQKLVLDRNQAMEADHTRKSQALAQERRQFEDDAAQVATELRERVGRIDHLVSALEAQVQTEVPLDDLYESNPTEAAKVEYQRRQRDNALKAAYAERDRQQTERAKTYRRDQMDKLLARNPSWGDQKTFAKVSGDVTSYLTRTYDATQEDLDNLVDHRVVEMAHKAMLYDLMVEEGDKKKAIAKKKVSKAPKALKPGTSGQANSKAERSAKLHKRLRSTGGVDDAVALLLDGG